MNYYSELDTSYMPIEQSLREYESLAKEGKPFYICIGREGGQYYTIKTKIINSTSYNTVKYVERLIKSLMYIVGGNKLYLGGDNILASVMKIHYSKEGPRAYDIEFMEKVFSSPFTVNIIDIKDIPSTNFTPIKINKEIMGAKIGLDLGGSDIKVSAVLDGKVLYSKESIWHPKLNSDPSYHRQEILKVLKKAASYLPRIDKIGISTAGVVIDNKVKIASLYVKVNKVDFKKYVENIYIDAAQAMGCDLVVANDGDITALAGSLTLGIDKLLGIAMGTSQASGYYDATCGLNGFLNELAFTPVDYYDGAVIDEWSGDSGVGANYFSQDAVIRLAEKSNIALEGSPAEKLAYIQALLKDNNDNVRKIFNTIGIYLGHTLPFYKRFYNYDSVLLLGRVMSGEGGVIIVNSAKEILKTFYSEHSIDIVVPDENMRRLGQSIAAAYL